LNGKLHVSVVDLDEATEIGEVSWQEKSGMVRVCCDEFQVLVYQKWRALLRQNLLYDFFVDVGEAEVSALEAVGELFVGEEPPGTSCGRSPNQAKSHRTGAE
jgi:hypothetical protein